jgi:hypothetical protein
MTDPKRIDAALRARLRRSFTVPQIVELTLDVSAWNKQKVLVALELDEPLDPRGPSRLTFDTQGHFRAEPPA